MIVSTIIYNGLNDWLRIPFPPSRDSGTDELVKAQEWTLQQFGERMSAQFTIGNYGAYHRGQCLERLKPELSIQHVEWGILVILSVKEYG